MHDLEERCGVRASNIEFARATADVHAWANPPQTACGWHADFCVGDCAVTVFQNKHGSMGHVVVSKDHLSGISTSSLDGKQEQNPEVNS